MVQRGEDLRRLIGREIGRAVSAGKAEVPRAVGHGRDDEGGVVARELHAVAHGSFVRAVIDFVGAVHVRQKQTVKAAPFQQLRQFHPVADVAVAGGTAVQRIVHWPSE